MRRLMILAWVGLAGAGVAILPSLGSAQGTAASFTAVDNGTFFGVPAWHANGTTASTLTIAPGGTVSFSYPTGTNTYNAVFDGPQPSACTQATAAPGYQVGPAPPLPQTSQPAGWSGSCRFDTPGTYSFHSAYQGTAMAGTITVATPSAAPPPATATQPPSAGGRPTVGTTTTFAEPPIPAAASALRAARRQGGSAVRGRIHVTAPGSRLVADLLLGSPPVRVGRATLHDVADGTKLFTVRLSASGRRALRMRRRLTLTLRVQVLLAGGLGPTTLSRRVTLTA